MAAFIGAAIFFIWWITSPRRAEISSPRDLVSALPRGGSLTGAVAADVDMQEVIDLLTAAPLARVNRTTDDVELWLAESSSPSSTDSRIITLKLRGNVMRADRTPLTASEAADAITKRRPEIAGKTITARAVDPLTVEITFPSPFAPALRLFDTLPIPGYGPFVLKGTGTDRRATFVRNPHYWRNAPDGKPLPYLDELVIEPAGTRADVLDFNENIRPADYRALRKADDEGKLRLYDAGPGLENDALWFNLSAKSAAAKPWLKSEAFRQAISTAIDRRAYCDRIFAGMCDPVAGPTTPGNGAWFMADLPAKYDVALARATLAGLDLQDRNRDGMLDDSRGNPVAFTMLVARDRETSIAGAEYVRDELKKVGVRVDVVAVDRAALRERMQSRSYEAVFDRLVMRDSDPALNLDFWLSAGGGHVWNPNQQTPATEWEAQIDQLMLKQAASADRVERVQLFADVQRILAEHTPVICFAAPYIYVATSTTLLNARPSRQRPSLLWSAETLAAASGQRPPNSK